MLSAQLTALIEFIPRLDHFMGRLQAIYQAMDRAYTEVAEYYGCSCEGCDGNCCTSYFFHYTAAEYLYLAKGFQTLSKERQNEIRHLADEFIKGHERAPAETGETGPMCPLNQNGLCGLYAYRPMICRLHGVPHSYRRPDLVLVRGKGCPNLVPLDINKKMACKELDRTRFYRDMAALEQELRWELSFRERIKVTVADMIVAIKKEGYYR